MAVKIEISDHDGYCSGEECTYKSWIEFRDDIKELSDVERLEKDKDVDLQQETFQSQYCTPSSECKEHGLGVHESRVTILSMDMTLSEAKTYTYTPMTKSANKRD